MYGERADIFESTDAPEWNQLARLNQMIADCAKWRAYYRARRLSAQTSGERSSAGIEGLAVAIREKALVEARDAILAERAGR